MKKGVFTQPRSNAAVGSYAEHVGEGPQSRQIATGRRSRRRGVSAVQRVKASLEGAIMTAQTAPRLARGHEKRNRTSPAGSPPGQLPAPVRTPRGPWSPA